MIVSERMKNSGEVIAQDGTGMITEETIMISVIIVTSTGMGVVRMTPVFIKGLLMITDRIPKITDVVILEVIDVAPSANTVLNLAKIHIAEMGKTLTVA